MLVVYSKGKKCGNCERVKALLTKYNVKYSVVNIDIDEVALQFLTLNGFKSVPQIFYDGTLFVEGGWTGLMKMSKDDIEAKVEMFKNKP